VRRNWFIAAAVVGVAAIVVAAVAMRLSDDGSDEPQSTTVWADSVCTDLSDWRDSITSLADVSGETLTPDVLREKLDQADSATTTLVSDLRDLGPPDLQAGDELRQELQSSVDDLESSYDDLKSAANDAAEASGTEFLQQLAGLATQFSSFVTALESTVDTLRNANVAEDSKAELQQAFDDASSCQSLQAES
jgi:hypothetical protein